MKTPTDTEMLDWLEKQGKYYGWSVQTESDYPNVRDCVWLSRNSSSGTKTAREAIAKAMEREVAP